jgi:hypothetical protein
MNNLLKTFSAILAGVTAISLSACDDNGGEKIDTTLEVAPDALTFEFDGAPQTVTVVSVPEWTAGLEVENDWLEIAPQNGSFTVTVTENESVQTRHATIVVGNGTESETKRIAVSQSADPGIVIVPQMTGNGSIMYWGDNWGMTPDIYEYSAEFSDATIGELVDGVYTGSGYNFSFTFFCAEANDTRIPDDTYTVADSKTPGTIQIGARDESGAPVLGAPAKYYHYVDGASTVGVIVSGEVKVSMKGEVYVIEFDVRDDSGKRVVGSFKNALKFMSLA